MFLEATCENMHHQLVINNAWDNRELQPGTLDRKSGRACWTILGASGKRSNNNSVNLSTAFCLLLKVM